MSPALLQSGSASAALDAVGPALWVLAHGVETEPFVSSNSITLGAIALAFASLVVAVALVVAARRRRDPNPWARRGDRLSKDLLAPYGDLLDDIEHRAGLAVFAQSQRELAKFAQQQTSFMKAVLDSIGAAICIVDRNGAILDHNARWTQLRCFADRRSPPTQGESLIKALTLCGAARGDTIRELIGPLRAFRDGQRVGHNATHRTRHGNRTEWLHAQLAPVEYPGELDAAVLCLFNVTERVEAERASREAQIHSEMLADALQSSRGALTITMDAAELATWQWDTETGHVEYGAYWPQLVGKPRRLVEPTLAELVGRVHPQEAADVKRHFEALANDDHLKGVDLEFRIRRESREYRWVHFRGQVIQESVPGVPRVMAGVISDVNDRREAQARSEALTRLLDAASAELVVLDAATLQIIEVSGDVCHGSGQAHDELVGSSLHTLLIPESFQAFIEALQSDEASTAAGAALEWRWDADEGKSRTVAGRVQRTTYLGSPAVVLHGVDVTERQQLEARLAQARKLESIGQLAAGVAHEINTPMQYVNSNVEFLKEAVPEVLDLVEQLKLTFSDSKLPAEVNRRVTQLDKMFSEAHYTDLEHDVNAALDDCAMGIGRVVEIVRAMKEFSHPGTDEHTSANLNELLASAATVSKSQWKAVADLHLDLDEDLPLVTCLAAELSQVFLNLIINAADAVGDALASAPLDDLSRLGEIWVRSRQVNAGVIIEVEDTGPGVPEEIRDRLFDPFFTTKDVGQGSGQGLAISHDVVVNKHGGSLSVASTPGEGACFRIVLPIAHENDCSAEQAKTASPGAVP
ncbi:MAG: ATP-binding protein [Planctomycetota bacterium]